MINMDLAISVASETDQAVGSLCGFVQLAEARQLPRLGQVHRRALVAAGFGFIEHATAQRGGDAHHGVKAFYFDEGPPLGGDVLFILGATTLAEALCTPS